MVPDSVLALTATAGENVIDDVTKTLNIPRACCEPFEDVGLDESDNLCKGDVTRGVRVLSTKRGNIDTGVLILDR